MIKDLTQLINDRTMAYEDDIVCSICGGDTRFVDSENGVCDSCNDDIFLDSINEDDDKIDLRK